MVQILVVRVDIGLVIYEAITCQCGRSVVQVLVVRVDIGVVTYEAMTPQCWRSVVQVLVVRVDIGVVIYEAMTLQCGRSVVQVLVVRVDIGVLIYEAMTPVWEVSGSGPGCYIWWILEWLPIRFNTPVSEVGSLVPITHFDYYVSSLCHVLHHT